MWAGLPPHAWKLGWSPFSVPMAFWGLKMVRGGSPSHSGQYDPAVWIPEGTQQFSLYKRGSRAPANFSPGPRCLSPQHLHSVGSGV